MLEWLIIGGGIHGTFLSHAFTAGSHYPRESVRVLDPHPLALQNWLLSSANCGMTYLRSPSSHNLDLDFRGLRRWVRRGPDRHADYIPPYERPSIDLFNRHCRAVIDEYELEQLRIRGVAELIVPSGAGLRVETDGAPIEARRVLLSLGRNDRLRLPSWAEAAMGAAPDRIAHIFMPRFSLSHIDTLSASSGSGEHVVVGAGIAGAQTALALWDRLRKPIHLLVRHELKVQQFDSLPCYLGPKCMEDFARIKDYNERRALIRESRFPGSVPPDIAENLASAERNGWIRLVRDQIVDAGLEFSGALRLHLGSGKTITAESVSLATGFAQGPPRTDLYRSVAHGMGLPVSACGFPIPDEGLHWGGGVYVSGDLAELELGPTSPNIIGAHNTFRRISRAAA